MVKDGHTGRKIAIGALLAGAFGYLTGLLTAPKSGKETRKDIIDKTSEVKSESIEQLQNLQAELEVLIQKTKDKTVALSSQAREEFDEAVVKAKDAKNKTATLLKGVKTGEADDPQLNRAIKQSKLAAKNLGKYYRS